MVESEARVMVKHCIKCELHGNYVEYSKGHKNSCLHRLCLCVFCQNHDKILVLLSRVRSRRRDVRRQWLMWIWEESLFYLAQMIMKKIWEETLFLQAQNIMKGIQVEMNGGSEIENLLTINKFNIKEEPIDSDDSDVNVTSVDHDARNHNPTLFQESPTLSFPTTSPRNEEGIEVKKNAPGVEFKYNFGHYEDSIDDMIKAKYCVKCELHGYYEVYINGHKNSCLYRLCPCEGCQDHDEMLDLLRMERSVRREVRERYRRWQEALFLQALIIMQRIEVELVEDIEIVDQFPSSTIVIKEEPMDTNNNYVEAERDTVCTEENSLPTLRNQDADEQGHAKEISRSEILINSGAPSCPSERWSSPSSISEGTGKKGDTDLPQCDVRDELELTEQVRVKRVASIDDRNKKAEKEIPNRKRVGHISIEEEEEEEKYFDEDVEMCQRTESQEDITSSQQDTPLAILMPPIMKENRKKTDCHGSTPIQVTKDMKLNDKASTEKDIMKEHRVNENRFNHKHQSKDVDRGKLKEKDKDVGGQGGENKVRGKVSSLTGTVKAHDNTSGPKCFFPDCGKVCRTRGNLKNHVLSHYYQIFYDVLPASKPYICPHPGCKNPPSRDLITLIRHFAFCHGKLFEMTDVTPKDFRKVLGRPQAKRKKKFFDKRLLKESRDKDTKIGSMVDKKVDNFEMKSREADDKRREGSITEDLQHDKENIERDKYRDRKGMEEMSGRDNHQSSLSKQMTPDFSISKLNSPNVAGLSRSGDKLMKPDKLFMNNVEKCRGEGSSPFRNKRARIEESGNSSSTYIYNDSFLEDFFIHNKVSEVLSSSPLQEVRVEKDIGIKVKPRSSNKGKEAMGARPSNISQKVLFNGIMNQHVKLKSAGLQ